MRCPTGRAVMTGPNAYDKLCCTICHSCRRTKLFRLYDANDEEMYVVWVMNYYGRRTLPVWNVVGVPIWRLWHLVYCQQGFIVARTKCTGCATNRVDCNLSGLKDMRNCKAVYLCGFMTRGSGCFDCYSERDGFDQGVTYQQDLMMQRRASTDNNSNAESGVVD